MLGILSARCGEDVYDFIVPEETEDEADDEEMPTPEEFEEQIAEATADYLREVLDPRGPPTPSFRELCGLLGAIAAGPESECTPQLFDGTIVQTPAMGEAHLLRLIARDPENAFMHTRLGNLFRGR